MSAETILAVSVAMTQDGRFLLVKRAREPARGLYAFPGGRVEIGERPEDAVRRELMEETGMKAGALSFVRELRLEGAASGSAYRLLVYTGSPAGGTPVAGDDAEAAGWFALSEMRRLPVTETTLAVAEEIAARIP